MKIGIIGILILSLLLMPSFAESADFAKAGWRLRLIAPVSTFVYEGTKFRAERDSQFEVIHADAAVDGNYYVEFKSVRPKEKERTQGVDYVQENRVYSVKKSEISEATCLFGQGLYLGVLTLPFKYHPETPTSQDVMTTNLNISSAIGWSFAKTGFITWTPMLFFGAENVAVGGSPDVQTKWGLTWGGGFAFSFARRGQIGIVIGGDHIPGAEGGTWPYQDKLWWSASLGFKFLDF